MDLGEILEIMQEVHLHSARARELLGRVAKENLALSLIPTVLKEEGLSIPP